MVPDEQGEELVSVVGAGRAARQAMLRPRGDHRPGELEAAQSVPSLYLIPKEQVLGNSIWFSFFSSPSTWHITWVRVTFLVCCVLRQ